MDQVIRLFIDCDPGIDDAIALGYALCQSDVEITGIAASAGNVPVDAVTRNALAWLELTGRTDIPVHRGAENPVAHRAGDPAPIFADDTHGPLGAGHAVLDEPTTPAHQLSAAEAWVQTARAHPGEVVGVVLGPHTNLALALRLEPELPTLLKRLFIMGGAFNYRGNTHPTTEWNITWDPEAASEVFAAFGAPGTPLPVIGPIEATEAVVMTPQLLEKITSSSSAAPGWRQYLGQLAEALRFYFEFHEWDGHGYLAQIHDPYVTAAAIGWARSQATDSLPGAEQEIIPWAHTADAAVDVELTGTLTRGETVADWLGRWNRQPNATLIRSLDASQFLTHLAETLMRGPDQ